jgi:hypothetical protein
MYCLYLQGGRWGRWLTHAGQYGATTQKNIIYMYVGDAELVSIVVMKLSHATKT